MTNAPKTTSNRQIGTCQETVYRATWDKNRGLGGDNIIIADHTNVTERQENISGARKKELVEEQIRRVKATAEESRCFDSETK